MVTLRTGTEFGLDKYISFTLIHLTHAMPDFRYIWKGSLALSVPFLVIEAVML